MCGISGFMNYTNLGISPNNLNSFAQMLYAGAVRGMHGTGCFAVAEKAVQRVKVGGPVHRLLETPEFLDFQKFVDKSWARILVGHNRHATKGKIITEHAHPFQHGDIILVHNGTLNSFEHLPDANKFEVDSEAICNAISVDGPEKTIKSLKGAWALVWYNTKEKTLNIIRNKERPLGIAYHNKDPIIAFASETAMLQWCLNRNGISDLSYYELPENMLHTWTLDNIKPHVKELKSETSKTYLFVDGQWEAWGQSSDVGGKSTNKNKVEDAKIVDLNKRLSDLSARSLQEKEEKPWPNHNYKSKRKTVTNDNGSWEAVQYIHDLSKEHRITAWPMEFRAISDKNKTEIGQMFQVILLNDDYPDIEFRCTIKGKENLAAVMDAQFGMRGKIIAIMRSMNNVAKFPHIIYLNEPEPQFIEEPEVPKSALLILKK